MASSSNQELGFYLIEHEKIKESMPKHLGNVRAVKVIGDRSDTEVEVRYGSELSIQRNAAQNFNTLRFLEDNLSGSVFVDMDMLDMLELQFPKAALYRQICPLEYNERKLDVSFWIYNAQLAKSTFHHLNNRFERCLGRSAVGRVKELSESEVLFECADVRAARKFVECHSSRRAQWPELHVVRVPKVAASGSFDPVTHERLEALKGTVGFWLREDEEEE